jgi:general secretion pathway protein G
MRASRDSQLYPAQLFALPIVSYCKPLQLPKTLSFEPSHPLNFMTTLDSSRRLGANLSRRRPSAPGFTLTEILIAIALIVTIVAVAVGNLSGLFTGGQKQVASVFVKDGIATPLMAYRTSTGSYPTTDQGLKALIAAPDGVTGWSGPYLTTTDVPKDPWNNYYVYVYPGTHHGTQNMYDVYSTGPNGSNAPESEWIGNW